MKILHKPSETLRDAVIELMADDDWEQVYQSDEFEFDWAKERKWTVYKLTLEGDTIIQELVAIEDIVRESRIHIHLIENALSNRGKDKIYDYVAGCLLASLCEIAFDKRYEGFVSLHSKTEIISLYTNKYRFREMGQNLFIMGENSLLLIEKYLR